MRNQTRPMQHQNRLVPVCSRYATSLAFAVMPLVAQGPALDDAFAAMDRVARQFRAVSADIKRDVYTADIDDHEKDEGTIKAKRNKRDTPMLIEFRSPAEKAIALAGTTAEIYTPKTKTVQEFGIKQGLVERFLLIGFGESSAEVKEQYEVKFLGAEKLGPDATWRLQLVPKSPDELKYLKRAELWIGQSSGLPVKEKLYTSTGGDYQLIDYSNVKLNPSLPDSAVKLSLPKGVSREHPRL